MYQKRNKELEVLMLYLGGYTKEFYLREMSKRAAMPLKTIRTAIMSFEERSVLKSSRAGKNKFFRLNLDNIQTKFYLLQAEAYKTIVFLQKYPVLKTFLKEVKTGGALLVFGSFARFSADADSDLDLLVVSKEKLALPVHLVPYKIQKIELSEASFFKSLEKQETLTKEIEENHVILSGHSFYLNAMWNHHGK